MQHVITGKQPSESTHGQGEVRCYWQLVSVATHIVVSVAAEQSSPLLLLLCEQIKVQAMELWTTLHGLGPDHADLYTRTHGHTHIHSTYMFGCVVGGVLSSWVPIKRAPTQ